MEPERRARTGLKRRSKDRLPRPPPFHLSEGQKLSNQWGPPQRDAVFLGSWEEGAAENGFKSQYKDGAKPVSTLGGVEWHGGNNSDQSHHFAMFIQLGFYAPTWLGQYANYVNDPATGGDNELGKAAISIGERLRAGKLKPQDVEGNTQ